MLKDLATRAWCLIVALACDILAFCQTLALARTPARKWEPRTLRLLSIPAVIARHARRTVLRYKAHHPLHQPPCHGAEAPAGPISPIGSRPRPIPAPQH